MATPKRLKGDYIKREIKSYYEEERVAPHKVPGYASLLKNVSFDAGPEV
jgi:hypothetical protein